MHISSNDLSLLVAILLIITAAIIYSIGRIVLNKKIDLNIPIIPERYYDNAQLTIIQFILIVFSFTTAVYILELIMWILGW